MVADPEPLQSHVSSHVSGSIVVLPLALQEPVAVPPHPGGGPHEKLPDVTHDLVRKYLQLPSNAW